jgi:hypothetical protein
LKSNNVILCFFISGDGYCRSEGIIAIYLQKHKDAKRIFCTIVHSKTNSDGNKEEGKYKARTTATRNKVNIMLGYKKKTKLGFPLKCKIDSNEINILIYIVCSYNEIATYSSFNSETCMKTQNKLSLRHANSKTIMHHGSTHKAAVRPYTTDQHTKQQLGKTMYHRSTHKTAVRPCTTDQHTKHNIIS